MEELIEQLKGKNVLEQEEAVLNFQKNTLEELYSLAYRDAKRVYLERLASQFGTDLDGVNVKLENVRKAMANYEKNKEKIQSQSDFIKAIFNKFNTANLEIMDKIIMLMSEIQSLETLLNINGEVKKAFQDKLYVLLDEIGLTNFDEMESRIIEEVKDNENVFPSINWYLKKQKEETYQNLQQLVLSINNEAKKYIMPFLNIPMNIMNSLKVDFSTEEHKDILLKVSSVYENNPNFREEILGINILFHVKFDQPRLTYILNLLDKFYATNFLLQLNTYVLFSKENWQKYLDDLTEYSLFLYESDLEATDKIEKFFLEHRNNNAALALKRALEKNDIVNLDRVVQKVDGVSISKEQAQIFVGNINKFFELDSFKMVKNIKAACNSLKPREDFEMSKIYQYFNYSGAEDMIRIIEDFILCFININQNLSIEQMNFAISLYTEGLINKDLICNFWKVKTENKQIPRLFITRLRGSMFENFLDDKSKSILANDYLCEIISRILMSAYCFPKDKMNAEYFKNIIETLLSSKFVNTENAINFINFMCNQSHQAQININIDYHKEEALRVAPTMAALTMILSRINLDENIDLNEEVYSKIFDMLMEHENILYNCQNNEYYLIHLIQKVMQIIKAQKAKTLTKK